MSDRTTYAVFSYGPRTRILETDDKERAHNTAQNFAPLCDSVYVVSSRPLDEGGVATTVDMYKSQEGKPLRCHTTTTPK